MTTRLAIKNDLFIWAIHELHALGAGKEAGQLQRLQLTERVQNVFDKVVARHGVSNVAQQILSTAYHWH